MPIRQPIITIAGHVDHGKTSILDCFRGSSIAESEAGGITQKISFTLFPAEQIKSCIVLDKYNQAIKIPGFLFIDTPGHAAFTNLRKRGGSLADLAILVIDINEGIKPQTTEVLSILKQNKTPFIIALNKIDQISGWQKPEDFNKTDLKTSIESQAINVKNNFNEKLYTLIASLQAHGFDSDLYYNIKDFTKKIALVPCSAKTKQGIKEIMMVLCGLSQKFLSTKLNLAKDAKGVILEIKKQKASQYIEAILYDGELKLNDQIAIANFDKTTINKIRNLEQIKPLSTSFKPTAKATAATGLRLQLASKQPIQPGMPFQIYKNNLNQLEKEFKKQIQENIKLDKQGIIIKADSLGSLEALITLLKQANIQILKAGIGSINKTDIISAKANLESNPLNSIILGFNVKLDEEAKELAKSYSQIKILTDEVIYKLIENLQEYKEEKQKQIEKNKMLGLAPICKLEVLHKYVFHNSNPAIFGVKILAGKLLPGTELISNSGEKIGKVKKIQSENTSVDQATQEQEVAISIPGTNFERKIKQEKFLYSNLTSDQFKNFKENKELLSPEELETIRQIAEIKKL